MSEGMHSVHVTVNGMQRDVGVPPGMSLLELLREELDLKGTKLNCEQGECGACTVLLDGRPVDSCLVLAVSIPGSSVQTIESLHDGRDPLQRAFVEADAAQCGYCTPGMIMAARGLLDANPDPTEPEVVAALEGNYCRCTGYDAIVRAVLGAAQETQL